MASVIAALALALCQGAAGATGDFDGDGHADLLLRHLHSDAWRFYTLLEDAPAEHALGLETEAVWRYVATGDFDGNGFDDVLVRRYDTLEAAYHAVSADGVEFRPIRVTVNPLYDVLGAGDFDGDGADEILIRRNETFGAWLYYDVDGTSTTLRRRFGPTENLDFEFMALGDLDGDGTDDILARHRIRGNWVAYLMRGTARAVLRRPRITANPLFTLQGLADITGDGTDDPILRNRTTHEWIYYATGNRVGTGQHIAMRLHRGLGMPRDQSWAIAAIGDFDGDGKATPLLRAALTGEWRLYDIDGSASDEVRFPGLEAELAWAAVDTLPRDNAATLAQVEFLQGPPTFRKDFRTGETIGPIAASRAESGDALEPWRWGGNFFEGPGVDVWFAENRGFVTSVWGRRMIVAAAATHAYRSPVPTLAVDLVPQNGEPVTLEVLLDTTAPDPMGYRTELAFELPAERHLPGGEVIVRMDTEGTTAEERLPLFGETVTTLSLTWIPVTMDDHEPLDLDIDGYVDRVVDHLPVGPYRTRLGEPLVYERTGAEGDAVFDYNDLFDQMLVHHAAHACGRGDLYFALYPFAEMRAAGIDIRAIGVGAGRIALGPTFRGGPDGWDGPPWYGVLGLYAHEVGHTLDLGHAPCKATSSLDEEYPYPDGGLGPARSWHPVFHEFIGRADGYRDVLSYCSPRALSDYHYQRALMYLQAPHYARWSSEADACWTDAEPSGARHRSLAVVGRVAPDGASTIVGTAPSTLPPTRAGDTASGWSLAVVGPGGAPVHRQPLLLEDHSEHGHELTPGRTWQVRMPYPDVDGATFVLRDDSGNVRMEQPILHAR